MISYADFIFALSLVAVSCGTVALVADTITVRFNPDFAIPCLICIGIGILGLVVSL